MADRKEINGYSVKDSSIKISEEVLEAIAKNAAKEIDGVFDLHYGFGGKKPILKGVKVKSGDGGLEYDVYIIVKFGASIAEVGRGIQQSVKAAVEGTTGFAVSTVNVHVNGVTGEE